MNGRKLDASYSTIRLQLGATDHAKQAALRPDVSAEFLARLGLPDLIGVTKNRRKAILEHFERAGRQIGRQGFIELVSSFEADLFRSLSMASSKVRHVLKIHYDTTYPFAAHREDLARTAADFSNLGGYRRLLAVPSSSRTDPRRDLWDVISHRDFLAHGERWACSATPPTIEFAYRIMSSELTRVEAAR